MPALGEQIAWLFVLAIPIACIAWTVTHEEVFREPREFCLKRSQRARRMYQRKFFYLFTCEYCFSHYVAFFVLWLTRYQLLVPGWRGYLLAAFALVWVANQYMGLFFRLRLGIKDEGVEIRWKEQVLEQEETPKPVGRKAASDKMRSLTRT